MIDLILLILFWIHSESFFGPFPRQPVAPPPPIERMIELQAP